MVCIFMYAVKAVADILLLMSEDLGKMVGILIAIGSLINIILYVPRLIRTIWLR